MKTPKPLVLGSNSIQPHLPVKYAGKTYKVPLVETIAYARFITKLRVKYPQMDIEQLPEAAQAEALEAFLEYQIPRDLLRAFEETQATTTIFMELMQAWVEAKTGGEEEEGLGEPVG